VTLKLLLSGSKKSALPVDPKYTGLGNWGETGRCDSMTRSETAPTIDAVSEAPD
jgi:hypothetical protein